MNNEKVNEALRACDQFAVAWFGSDGNTYPERYDWTNDAPFGDGLRRHLRWMIREALSWGPERIEKKFRWLGFVQGALWAGGDATIEQLKKMNVPEES